MTVNKINPDDKELRFRDLIDTINDTIDELNSASNVHYVKRAGDVIQGTLTANGTQGVMFAATGGGFSRPITFEDDNLPFNNTSGTTVAFLGTQGSFNLTGRINFVETSVSPYSWRFLPDYGNNELKLQGANNTTIMAITDSQVKFESDVEIEEDLIIGGKATVGGEFTYGKAKNISGTDLDTLTTPGFYDGQNLTNAPNGQWFYIEVQRHSLSDNYVLQRATAITASGYATWVRNRNAGVWSPWRQVWDSQTFDPAEYISRDLLIGMLFDDTSPLGPPPGFLFADGREVSRTTYAKLFARIGTTYGAGDGETTFNLPDARGRATFGIETEATARLSAYITSTVIGTTGGSQHMQSHTHTGSGTTSAAGDHAHWINLNTSENGWHSHWIPFGSYSSTIEHTVMGGPSRIITGYAYDSGRSSDGGGSHIHNVQGNTAGGGAHSHTYSFTTSTAGSGTYGNLPPLIIVRKVIYTGVH